MSAVYDDVKRKAMQQQARGFTTMLDEAGPPVAGMPSDYSSSSLGQYIGSAFITGAVVLYATHHGDENAMGERAKVQPVRAGQIFPFIGHTDTSTMSLASSWLASEPEVYNSGVLDLPWSRKVLYSGEVHFTRQQLQRRGPRTIIADDVGEENG